MLEIQQMLVLSTAHLTPEACNEYLPTCPFATFEKGDYGWFVYVADDLPDDIPAPLAEAIKFAQAMCCHWIMFDRDGPEIEALPVYEW